MGLKISDMTTAGALDGSELVPVVQGGGNFKTTTNNLRGGGVTAYVSGSDFSSSSAALIDITGLTFAAVANTLYEFEAFMRLGFYNTAQNWSCGVQFSAAGAACSWTGLGLYGTNVIIGSNTLNGSGGSIAVSNLGDIGVVIMKGWVKTGANAGNITIRGGSSSGGVWHITIGSRLFVRTLP